jgi:cell division protein FtsB
MRKLLYNPITIILSTLFVIIASNSLMHSRQSLKKSGSITSQVEEKIAELKTQNQELRLNVAELQTPEVIEQQIRDQLLLVKPGEYLVQVPESTPSNLPSSAPPSPSPTLSPWQQWQLLLWK